VSASFDNPVDAPAAIFSEVMVRPSFFFSAPAIGPRTVWRAQPIASAICSTVAPSGRLSMAIISACLVSGRLSARRHGLPRAARRSA
jgi:hypothetical protein